MLKRLGWRGMLVGLVVGLGAGGTLASAAIPTGTTGNIWACYRITGPNKGALRIVDHQAGQACHAGEAMLSWPSHGLRWRGTWSPTSTYSPNDAVSYQGSSFVSLIGSNSTTPTAGASWGLLAGHGDAGQQGTTGTAGPTGAAGGSGAVGGVGGSGPSGATGGTGPAGPQGVTGATGGTGVQGTPGATGGTGPSGVALCTGYPHEGIDWSIPGSTPGNGCNLTGAFLATRGPRQRGSD